MSASCKAAVNASDVYRSGVAVVHQTCCSKVESDLRRVNNACSTTLVTNGVCLLVMTRHPRMRRENTSTRNDT